MKTVETEDKTPSDFGYQEAFYKIAEIMGIGAQPLSPKEVFEQQMMPRLKAAFASNTEELIP